MDQASTLRKMVSQSGAVMSLDRNVCSFSGLSGPEISRLLCWLRECQCRVQAAHFLVEGCGSSRDILDIDPDSLETSEWLMKLKLLSGESGSFIALFSDLAPSEFMRNDFKQIRFVTPNDVKSTIEYAAELYDVGRVSEIGIVVKDVTDASMARSIYARLGQIINPERVRLDYIGFLTVNDFLGEVAAVRKSLVDWYSGDSVLSSRAIFLKRLINWLGLN